MSFSQIFFGGGKEKALWDRSKGGDSVQNSGLWRSRLCLLRAPGTVLTGACSQKIYTERGQDSKTIKRRKHRALGMQTYISCFFYLFENR